MQPPDPLSEMVTLTKTLAGPTSHPKLPGFMTSCPMVYPEKECCGGNKQRGPNCQLKRIRLFQLPALPALSERQLLD